MKSPAKIAIAAVVIIVIAVAGGFILTGNATNNPGKYDNFASCLSENGVKMYGAYWCPHCNDQKNMFGSSWDNINYVECSLPNRAGQTSQCTQAGIEAYPTWEFNDGSRIEGAMSMNQLSQKAGCAIE